MMDLARTGCSSCGTKMYGRRYIPLEIKMSVLLHLEEITYGIGLTTAAGLLCSKDSCLYAYFTRVAHKKDDSLEPEANDQLHPG